MQSSSFEDGVQLTETGQGYMNPSLNALSMVEKVFAVMESSAKRWKRRRSRGSDEDETDFQDGVNHFDERDEL